MLDSQELKCACAIFKLDKEPTQSVYVRSLVIRLICRVCNLFAFSPFLEWFLFALLSFFTLDSDKHFLCYFVFSSHKYRSVVSRYS